MFYAYNQNNSGGSFEHDPQAGISHYVIIEADSASDANARAQGIGLYFDGIESGYDCECCGDRWYEAWKNSGTETPQIYGKDARTYTPSRVFEIKWMDGPEGFIHYKDGRIEGFWETA